MYPIIPIWLAITFVAFGLYVLAWSADRFVGGAEAVSRALGVSPFIIGMVIVGFGTSAPELVVSALSGMAGHSNLSLGNAYGSNFFNSLAVVGTSGAISPFRDVSPLVFTRDLPVMVLLTLSIGIVGFNLRNPRSSGTISRPCGIIWLAAFLAYLVLLIRQEAFMA